jgi:hypothetical protein
LRNPSPSLLAPGDRPPPRPTRPPPPRASSAVPAKPGGDKVAEAYRDLLNEIVEKKKQQAEIRKRPPKKRPKAVFRAVLAVLLPPVAAAVWIFNPFAPAPPAPPRIPDEILSWQAALIDAALAIREWKDSAGAFPGDLAAAEIQLRGVTYTVSGPEDFVLQTFTTEGVVTVWMEGESLGTGPKPLLPDPSLEPAPVYP